MIATPSFSRTKTTGGAIIKTHMQNALSLTKFSIVAVVLFAIIATIVLLPTPSSAASGTLGNINNTISNIGQRAGLTNTPLEEAIGNLINIFLATLGIIAVCIVIYGGFLWMTASGNTEQVETAQTLLIQGLIGFVIIALAWSIATYVVTKIAGAL